MKKLVLCVVFLCALPLVFAESIGEYLEDVDEFVYLTVGDNSPAGDSLAAADIALGLQTENGIDVPSVLEAEVSAGVPKILVGHPCENTYLEESLDITCEEWPYEGGQAIIKVEDQHLIVAGSTVNDRRRAAKILTDYIDYEILYNYSFLLVLGNTLNPLDLSLEEAKEEFTCGDGVCEPGEKFLCQPDCNQLTCFQVCEAEGFIEASCREVPANPSLTICNEDEVNKGFTYCANERSCCCKKAPEENNTQAPEEPVELEVVPEEKSFPLILAIVFGLAGLIIIIILVSVLRRK